MTLGLRGFVSRRRPLALPLAGVLGLWLGTAAAAGLDIDSMGVTLAVAPGIDYGFGQTLEGELSYHCDFPWFSLGGGLALWGVTRGAAGAPAADSREFDAFVSARGSLPVRLPLSVELAYLYTGMPGYDTESSVLMTTLSLRGRYAGISLGAPLRWTTFLGEEPVFESNIAFAVYVTGYFINDGIRVGARWGNYDDFHAGNIGTYCLNLNTAVDLTDFFPRIFGWIFGRHFAAVTVSLVNELEFYQSGGLVFAALFRGLTWRGGIQVSW